MTYSHFDSRVQWIDRFHKAMFDLEKLMHKDSEMEINLCLKHELKNEFSNNLFWSTEPPGKYYRLNRSYFVAHDGQ